MFEVAWVAFLKSKIEFDLHVPYQLVNRLSMHFLDGSLYRR